MERREIGGERREGKNEFGEKKRRRRNLDVHF
jgi:hypothetical protein